MKQEKDLTGEIVMYQPDETIRLEVRTDGETVWLSANQMAILFDRDEKTVRKHINNVFSEGEVLKEINTHFLRVDGVKQPVAFYTLDVIISVGYRVKSKRGTDFRRWATGILKEYLLHGYAVNNRFEQLEHRMYEAEEEINFFVRTSLPPVEGIFYDGQIFDAYRFASDLVRKAKRSVVLIDNYVDDTVLSLLDKRADNVTATIYTQNISHQLQLDLNRHNVQYTPIEIKTFNKSHDRFVLIDDEVYHIGASLKDLGKKWFAFTLLHDIMASELLNRIEKN